MKDLQQLVRPNIWSLKPYSSARDEFKGEASVYLDANENPLRDNYNRYPDPLQWTLKAKIAEVKGVAAESIFLGNGSDEPIDLVFRIFCEPAVDNVVAMNPTYGMYQVCADINHVEYRKVALNKDFSLNADRILRATDANTKIIFLCSPNNPTGNLLDKKEVEKIITSFDGIVVVDEAYIDFASEGTLMAELDNYPNLIILQTFSKAWGLAAVRLGMAFASPEIIGLFNKVKYPYNVNALTQEFVSKALDNTAQTKAWIDTILKGRSYLVGELSKNKLVEKIYPTDANFVLVKVADAVGIYNKLAEKGIIVRNRNSVAMCGGCLRITVGTEEENRSLITALQHLQ
ncbi:histidinol-phosphate transaminase [Dysgonomonas sp. 25]|uniref:histidinol-phosphate transaminase n=1 Tax=Dysgonomonas sp. 25 TaxID=2302933 RepID=UPI0013CFCF72|nr:histidinol-phosphate transaminase [Dysgonomonas sp. 25]NDV68189.1 histidinol-phosphate transaminase [Dysgonomonas sp. 25]